MDLAISGRVAAEVRAELARRRLTTRELAVGAGIALTTLRRRLAGESAFTLDELAAIAGCFGIPLMTLLERAESQYQEVTP